MGVGWGLQPSPSFCKLVGPVHSGPTFNVGTRIRFLVVHQFHHKLAELRNKHLIGMLTLIVFSRVYPSGFVNAIWERQQQLVCSLEQT